MCDLPCATDDVLDVIKCGCKSGRCVPPCKCASHSPRLLCTEMCACGADDQLCDKIMGDESDTGDEYDTHDADSDEDSDSTI